MTKILSALINRLLPELINDLLDRVEKEALERANLLGHKTILLKVTVNDLPAIILIDGTIVDMGSVVLTIISGN